MRIFTFLISLFLPFTVSAATLPEHQPISILIIADEVNPHRLSDNDLTQPEDLAPALSDTLSSLNLSSINTVNSLCADDAIRTLQSQQRPDVVLYFAHRGAAYCNGENAQDDLTELIESGLHNGLGMVVLHHGLYVDFMNRGVKAELLHLIGSEADSIEWNTNAGQKVINVGGSHFITSNGLRYDQQVDYAGTKDVDAGSYPAFTNTPDELYEIIRQHEVPGELRTPLFATDSGDSRVLAYVLSRGNWTGRIVTYQPGEYQPNALDDKDGPNFQILVNAIYFAAFGNDIGQ